MTLEKLHSIVIHLAGIAPTQFWPVWIDGEPSETQRMAVRIHPLPFRAGRPIPTPEMHKEMLDLGGLWDIKFQLWIFERED